MSNEFENYDAFQKRMTERFPKMFANPYGGFAVDEGWWPILEELCSNIQGHIEWQKGACPQVIVAQIKEKFGGLRFYYEGGDEQIRGMVGMAESWAAHTCEVCGHPGKSRQGGWIKTLCDHHEAERQQRVKQYENQTSQ